MDELSDEERSHREVEDFLAPNVYLRNSMPEGESLDEKCVNCAMEAMSHLFPEEEIAWLVVLGLPIKSQICLVV